MAMRQVCWREWPTTRETNESGKSMSTFRTCPRSPTSRLVGTSSTILPSVSSDPASWPGAGQGGKELGEKEREREQ